LDCWLAGILDDGDGVAPSAPEFMNPSIQTTSFPVCESATKPVCAVTGSNGYVGSCVRNHLAAHGWEVLDFVRRPAGAAARPFQLGADISGAALVGVNVLVHCAYDFKPLRWEDIQAVNVAGTEKLFQAARGAGVGKIICISSISAYEGCRSLYGKAKLEIEKVALNHGALTIRPGLVYGPGPGGMFGKLTGQIQKSSVIPLIGDGSQIQFLVQHEDLCAFIGNYAADKTPGLPPLLTAAHPQPWPFKQLLLEIAHGLNRRVKFVPLPWHLAWLGLKAAETCGLRLNFRSDSLISLMYQNPAPDFSANAAVGLVCRPFRAAA
jgi:nucleoside-diphosphate-sugar epimerase